MVHSGLDSRITTLSRMVVMALTLVSPKHGGTDMTNGTATLQAGRISFEAKGRKAKGKGHKVATVARVNRAGAGITVLMGCGIPLLSLSLSTVSGTLYRAAHPILGTAFLAVMGSVLVVSLSHLAWAVGDITRSPRWASWAMAIAFDLALVLGETVHVAASDAGLMALTTSIMVAVCGASMLLNVWAFLAGHKGT